MQRRLGDTRGAGVATQRVTTHSPGRARRERQVLGEDAWYSVCEWTLDGAAQFDDLATAVIHDNPDAADVFNSVISLTPTPALQRTGSGSLEITSAWGPSEVLSSPSTSDSRERMSSVEQWRIR
ncbi:hypothetical protein PC111_g14272 [Phytophthora cactorum]|nr:hypothetical protein PC111_g14272 [Phytophthora cactorum]